MNINSILIELITSVLSRSTLKTEILDSNFDDMRFKVRSVLSVNPKSFTNLVLMLESWGLTAKLISKKLLGPNSVEHIYTIFDPNKKVELKLTPEEVSKECYINEHGDVATYGLANSLEFTSRDGKVIEPSYIDDEICAIFGKNPDPSKFMSFGNIDFENWYDDLIRSCYLAPTKMKQTWKFIRSYWLGLYFNYTGEVNSFDYIKIKNMVKIINYLDSKYTVRLVHEIIIIRCR